MGKTINRFIVNLGLFIGGVASAFSGMLIQGKYHMGNHGSIAVNDIVLGVNYQGWAILHKVAIVVFSVLVICHVYLHWKWYNAVFAKRLFAKNQQVLIFSLLVALVAITGFTPWLIGAMTGDEIVRKVFVEIHDKLAIIMTVYLILHVVHRLKWYFTAFEKIKNKQ